MYLTFIKDKRGRKELHNVRSAHFIYYIYIYFHIELIDYRAFEK